jgi:tripartite-type tricarboxylate transporter receptor subunit TctC
MKKLLLLLALAVAALQALAQSDFPNKPVTFVVATPAGGATDKAVRLVARTLQARWKQTIIVENRAGASGNIASAYVAKAAPDGYTLLVSAGPFAINPSLFKTLPFDTKKDFVPVAQFSGFSNVLLVHESFPAKTFNEFLAIAKNPSKPLAYASPGSGTAQHLTMELLRGPLKLNLNHIPYQGGAPAMNDLLAGHVPVMLAGMGDASPHLGGGRVRALATTGKVRSPLLPQVPTFQELGIMDFDSSGWNGLHAPAGTPAALISKINSDVDAALADPEVRKGMAAMDIEPRPLSVAEFKTFMDQQFARWKEAVDISGASAD